MRTLLACYEVQSDLVYLHCILCDKRFFSKFFQDTLLKSSGVWCLGENIELELATVLGDIEYGWK